MVTAEGEAGRKTVLCEANICRPASSTLRHPREKHCTDEDVEVLGSNGGLRCVTTPIEVDLPFTPAKHCEGQEQHLADIRGFHVSGSINYFLLSLESWRLLTEFLSAPKTFSSTS
jgi:hypothetical protein